MARSVAEWVGATPDTPVPPRVRLRVFERDEGENLPAALGLTTGFSQLDGD